MTEAGLGTLDDLDGQGQREAMRSYTTKSLYSLDL